MISQLVRSASWKKALRENKWTPFFQTGISFRNFLERQEQSVASNLRVLGIMK